MAPGVVRKGKDVYHATEPASMIISVHIPKTAGTSLRTGLGQRFGSRLLLDYKGWPASGSLSDRFCRLWEKIEVYRSLKTLTANYDVIHGHFLASKYFPLRAQALFCAFFRDPVDRVVSHYRHVLRNPNPDNPVWAHVDPTGMTLGQYASLPRQQRIYALFTSGLPMDRFTFVGLTEEYKTSLDLFRAIFGVDIEYHRVNVDEHVPDNIPPDELTTVKASQHMNYRIYDAARRRFDTLCHQHLRG